MDVEVMERTGSVYYNGYSFKLIGSIVHDPMKTIVMGEKARQRSEAVSFCQWTIDNDLAVKK